MLPSFLPHRLRCRRSFGARPPRALLAVERLEDRALCSVASNPAVIPVPGLSLWKERFEHFADRHIPNPNVLFLGDSILWRFAHRAGERPWHVEIAPRNAADFAISGSTTENVLWQVEHGGLNRVAPRAIVLLIGTNNLGVHQSPAETAAGVQACLKAIEANLPSARILLLGILPRGVSPREPLRQTITATNALLARLADGHSVTYADIGGVLLRKDGTLLDGVLSNNVHPTRFGYQLLANALSPLLDQFAGKPPSPPSSPSHPNGPPNHS